MNGSLQLFEYPRPMVRLACEKCGRVAQYRKENLIERYGRERTPARDPTILIPQSWTLNRRQIRVRRPISESDLPYKANVVT